MHIVHVHVLDSGREKYDPTTLFRIVSERSNDMCGTKELL